MAIRKHQAAFVSGELTPYLHARENKEIYEQGLKEARNVYITPQGGAIRREGLAMIARLPNDVRGRLVSFEFNTEQVYLTCFTPGRMDVFRGENRVATIADASVSGITASVLESMNWTQSADTLIVVHEDLSPLRITRTSHTAWAVSSATFSNIPTHDFGAGAEAVMSVTRGWPRSAAFKYGRLWLGGVKSRPQSIFGSKSGDFFNLNVGTGLDSDAIYITIDDDRVNAIRNLFPGRVLQIFTKGGEFYIQGELDDPITPGKIAQQLKKGTFHGSGAARPESVDGSTVFVEESGHAVRQFVYADNEKSYNATNLSLLSPHLVRNPQRMAVRRATDVYPSDYLYLVNADGTMAVLNVLRNEGLLAWALFETDGRFEDVAVVGQDVYVIVQRSINGAHMRFIEKLDVTHKLDCSVKVLSSATPLGVPGVVVNSARTEWHGFDHLEGAEVKVLGDDYVLEDTVVTGGAVISSEAVRVMEAGLPFLARVALLPPAIVIAGQSWAGDYKRLVWVRPHLLESRGVVIRLGGGKVFKPSWRQFGEAVLDRPAELFTGFKEVYLEGHEREPEVIITQEDPLEFHLLGVALGIGV